MLLCACRARFLLHQSLLSLEEPVPSQMLPCRLLPPLPVPAPLP